MTEEETEEYNNALKLFAGIALPGVIMAGFVTSETAAKKSFDIAEAMMVESKKREKSCTPE